MGVHTYDAQRAFYISLCWAVNQNPQYLMLSQAMWSGMFWMETASKLFFPSNGLWLTLILHFEILSGSPKVFFKLYCAWLLGHTPLPSSYASLVNFVMGIWEYIGQRYFFFFGRQCDIARILDGMPFLFTIRLPTSPPDMIKYYFMEKNDFLSIRKNTLSKYSFCNTLCS